MSNQEFITERIEFVPQIFEVEPFGGSKKKSFVSKDSTEALQLASKHKKKILNWYKKHLEKGDGYYFKSAKVTMNDNGVITVEYQVFKNQKEDFQLALQHGDALNPDDDGNHPIMKNFVVFPFKHSQKVRMTKLIKDNYVNFKKVSKKSTNK